MTELALGSSLAVAFEKIPADGDLLLAVRQVSWRKAQACCDLLPQPRGKLSCLLIAILILLGAMDESAVWATTLLILEVMAEDELVFAHPQVGHLAHVWMAISATLASFAHIPQEVSTDGI